MYTYPQVCMPDNAVSKKVRNVSPGWLANLLRDYRQVPSPLCHRKNEEGGAGW